MSENNHYCVRSGVAVVIVPLFEHYRIKIQRMLCWSTVSLMCCSCHIPTSDSVSLWWERSSKEERRKRSGLGYYMMCYVLTPSPTSRYRLPAAQNHFHECTSTKNFASSVTVVNELEARISNDWSLDCTTFCKHKTQIVSVFTSSQKYPSDRCLKNSTATCLAQLIICLS